jgi:sugar lactone lactonase YvrE
MPGPIDVFATLGAAVGEGPVWDPRTDTFVSVDILGGLVFGHSEDGTLVSSTAVGDHVGAALPSSSPGLLLAMRAGWTYLNADQLLEPLSLPVADDPTVRFNDASCDPLGRAFGGTMAYDEAPGRGSLYRLDPGLASRQVVAYVTLSNGLGWSPDGKTLYFIDSGAQTIAAYPYEVEEHKLGVPRTLVSFDPREGMPDGLTVDESGAVWVALFGGGQVRRYSPGGVLDRAVDLPVSQPTSLALGGRDGRMLVITTARHNLTDAELEAEPHAGDIFAMECSTPGQPTPLWEDLR